VSQTDVAAHVIPKDMALQLCAEVRLQSPGKRYPFAGMQCWGCTTLAKGDPASMCVSSRPGYRGRNLVNACYSSSLVSGLTSHGCSSLCRATCQNRMRR
jgi:hypothetical protein